jgi:methylated-DNA-[protein]-cysteine S-methyltransferase
MSMPDLDTADITPFQRKVYRAAMRIPRGKVTTYAALARAIGCRSARAVGQALRRNPFAPAVPCHRVITSRLTLGGFAGQRQGPNITRKRHLLAAEGVKFRPDERLDNPQQVIELGDILM